MKRKKKKIGLALGGGGARGFAHIGVLRVLEEESIPVDIIVGTSSGALVGASYASGIGPDKLEEIIEGYLESPEFHSSAINAIEAARNREDTGLAHKIESYLKNKIILLQTMFKPGILSAKDFRTMIDYLIPDINIENTPIPFRAVATDLVSGNPVIFSEGSLREAVMASSAVPGAIQPLKKDDYLLSDGGIIAHVPVSATIREGADRVIAVVVSKDILLEDELRNAQEILSRANDLTTHYLVKYELTRADVVIRPSVGTLHWSEFSHAQHLIRAGEDAARENIGPIRSIIPGMKKWFTIGHYIRLCRRKQRKAPLPL
ncbi:MAG: patatin-like phospholipase family protein [Thermodesulfobacteriota bacterium]|nr:patatin-like phospholipase family protein [Thermodesulfobacteriota bacterium]